MNVVWRRSGHDDQVHAFPLAQAAEPGRGYLEVLCTHSAPPTVLKPAVHLAGHWSALLDVSTCMACLLIVGDQLADAGGDPGRHSTPPP